MKRILLVICLFTAIGCNPPMPKDKVMNDLADSTTVTVTEGDTTLSPLNVYDNKIKAENWTYSEQEDKMTNEPIYFANCDAKNIFNFNFPYDGGSRLSIVIRKMSGKNEVILQISKGQFSSAYNSSVKMKFDEGKILSYDFTEAADGSSDYIFLHPASSIIKKIKNAKSIKIEAPFFEQGRQIAEFNVSGLNWKH